MSKDDKHFAVARLTIRDTLFDGAGRPLSDETSDLAKPYRCGLTMGILSRLGLSARLIAELAVALDREGLPGMEITWEYSTPDAPLEEINA